MSRTRGMTLIEVALAVAILATMMTLTWGTLSRSFDAFDTLTEVDGRFHNAQVALDRMSREISMAYLTAPERNLGREEMWKTLFRGKRASPFHELQFTSFSHDILRADAKESDQCELGYFGAPDPDRAGVINLMRREDPRPDREPDEGGRAYVLAEDVKDLKLRFYDPKNDEWTEEWDTEDPEHVGRLPTIVEITLTLADIHGEDVKFMTKTRIHLPVVLSRF